MKPQCLYLSDDRCQSRKTPVSLGWSWGQNPCCWVPSQALSTTASLRVVIKRETPLQKFAWGPRVDFIPPSPVHNQVKAGVSKR